MNKLILCEGKIDAVILGCYLGKAAGWTPCKKAPSSLNIQSDQENQIIKWYHKNGDKLAICAVGGKYNFQNFFKKKIEFLLFNDDDAFEKIAIVRDRDDSDMQDIVISANSTLESMSANLQNNEWVVCPYKKSYNEDEIIPLEVLLVVVPETQGAIETMLLEAIKEENEHNGNIVKKTEEFAKQMYNEKHIPKPSLIPKVNLGLTLAILYPSIAFTSSDEQINKVHWEESDTLRNCFSKLIEI